MKKCSERFGVVVLAAGASRRMGQPKALLPWQGGTVLETHLKGWTDAGAAQLVVVVDPANTAIMAELHRLRWQDVVTNQQLEQGMMSSLLAASLWPGWEAGLTHVVVVLVDQPQFPPSAMRDLLALACERPQSICQPQYQGRRGHPVVLPFSVFLGLGHTQTPTLRDFLRASECPRHGVEVAQAWWLDDMNVPEGYERLQRLGKRDG